MSTLNPMQEQATKTTNGHILVLAGAGTGKTTVLTERAMRLIETGEAKPYQILSITFTNKAAKEMTDRIAAQAGDTPLNDMWTCTFHSMCSRILRRFPLDGYTPGFSIYDADDSLNVVKTVLKNMGLQRRYKPAEIKNIISSYKNSVNCIPEDRHVSQSSEGYKSLAEAEEESSGLTCGQYAKQIDYQYQKSDVENIDRIYNAYQRTLLEQNAMDFDDLLIGALRVLLENEHARTTLQRRFRYIMVDEYQDTNPVQYRLVRILSGGHGNLFCVGDDDQSIYKFRGADVGIIRRFEDDFPDAEIIRLEQNYRSTNAILRASNAVISQNSDRYGKTLWSENGAGEPPIVMRTFDEEEEAQRICEDILERHNKTGEPFEANAVLYRMHSISRSIEEAMIRNKIPYRIYGGVSFYMRKEIRDMLAYLWIIANPRAEQQLLRIINVPARKLGPASVAKIQAAAAERGVPMLEVMRHADEWLGETALRKNARAFADLYDSIAKDALTRPVAETIRMVFQATGYEHMLRSEDTDEAADRADNVGELISAAAAYDEEHGPDFAGFMEYVSLLTDQDRTGKDEDAVSLMTVHAAKGLEFDNVYVAGLQEEIFPSYRAVVSGDVAEERRLCYVALTRARKRLMLLTTSMRWMYGQTRTYRPSRFLSELPRDVAGKKGGKRPARRRTSAREPKPAKT